MSDLPSSLKLVLVCKTLPEIGESALVGLQDKEQAVHAGVQAKNGSHEFSCEIQLRDKGSGVVDYAGAFVHGKPQERFVYLSWKRMGTCAAPWVQRVKVPLRFSAAELAKASVLRADITGRKPHSIDTVAWQIT
ncbi:MULTISPECIES: DUF5990 family protein [Pseudomonadota]|jgi:hypothetical protein|uniref:DUF5990 family protein n=1 Tax=Pseudomonadota TaxID=1224 RepID=UPI0008D34A62|nr:MULTISPECIES: DUF5990 family protein [Pseudomonadota]MBP1123977.1 hypothetical protein [Pseudomonas sp. PvP025]MDO9418512.1 DUF5990 family protein [Pararhizobium sp.]MDQ0397837.1 hypothetical protein [Pseudomonas sp. PvP006]SEU11143.1 hypothetical protein SAMN03159512_05171 [Pseudomonas sp. NFR09]